MPHFPRFPKFLSKVLSLSKSGQLMKATRTIQENLKAAGLAANPGPVIDPDLNAYRASAADKSTIDVGDSAFGPSFTQATFVSGGLRYLYRLYIPARSDDSPLPVMVMLHGCKQEAADFARGTAMNELAEREKFIVLYPEQLRSSNSMGCWNWFHRSHQSQGSGEPAMIAALALHVAENFDGDKSRIYVAGLSAGGAMAALLGKLYPETFAAVGVHSGLAPGAARDVVSAFSVMAKGPNAATEAEAIGVPVIVFQGTGDKTVNPKNATSIIGAEVKSWLEKGVPLLPQKVAAQTQGLRAVDRTVWRSDSGRPYLELWSIKGGPHAWSGGNSGNSFTDGEGPSATAAMMEFFKQHSLAETTESLAPASLL